MASYEFRRIEKDWREYWAKNGTFRADQDNLPKYYVLDMFPYPSGAGLHVGHPLGYIASDIVSRYKRHKGFNVLHPMGWDAFGLPAEQYAIQTGQHPAVTTEENLKRYREQMDNIGFSFDWTREIKTSDPSYYKWTQWIFIQLFDSWYNNTSDKAESVETLIKEFDSFGNTKVNAATDETRTFTAEEWKGFGDAERSKTLLNYRLAFLSEAMVNWCAALGTVLANDEVKDGVSERGGHPVERKLMTQWSLRISAYSERLLQGLDTIDWTDSMKEAQRNWIGKSEGTSLKFKLKDMADHIEVFTTRPDTIFGVSFLTLAPEHELVAQITTNEYKDAVEAYITVAKNRSERDRMADIKNISGQFTGAYAEHPFTGAPIPVWIGDYVLAGYGTGAVMAVPGHDSRDYSFAKHFDLPIIEVVQGGDLSVESYDAKEGKLVNSGFLDGLEVKAAIKKVIHEVEQKGLGTGKTNYRLRNAVFGRQRYWGEPIPVYYQNDIPHAVNEKDLPLILPEIDKYLPTETGEPPLARAKDWTYKGMPLENTTMPGWAGSSWYYLRYMDPNNDNDLASPDLIKYWQDVDLYIGGTEHATGHLLYARFWCKFLKDIGKIHFDEPFKKLVNQGMILGNSPFLRNILVKNSSDKTRKIFISANDQNSSFEIMVKGITDVYAKVEELESVRLPLEIIKDGNRVYKTDLLRLSDNANVTNKIKGFLILPGMPEVFSPLFPTLNSSNDYLEVEWETEKMSKSKWNVVNPDDVCNDYGADTLRLYEMFLGPLQDAKPWSTQGIEGVLRFLRKLWRLFHNNAEETFLLSDEAPTKAEWKTLHKTIKKATEDIDNFSFNTSVSAFMVCVNELQDTKCNKRSILEPLVILVSPYAPHIAEELWKLCGHAESIERAAWPAFNPEYLVENEFFYPVSFNGKVRFNMNFALDKATEEIEKEVLADEQTLKYLEGKTPKKIIVVKGRIINVVA